MHGERVDSCWSSGPRRMRTDCRFVELTRKAEICRLHELVGAIWIAVWGDGVIRRL